MSKMSDSNRASARPRRSALDRPNRLSIKNKEAGYHYRIVNDVDDRVEQLQALGYEICTKESIGAVGDRRIDNPSSLGSSSHISVGQGRKAVVMRQKDEYYKEDQSMKQAQLDEIERTMTKGKSDYGTFEINNR